ncbi:hypothetical protein ANN_15328 [Periplaneta americana]|uniref:Uncharacterized protein n=1 Tax=Periplaneta americana TaxID=6978 RepID=A0ABQ8SH84_PERAM|nr:hypothetical protein ANN_15328 [Periplaneta americana]
MGRENDARCSYSSQISARRRLNLEGYKRVVSPPPACPSAPATTSSGKLQSCRVLLGSNITQQRTPHHTSYSAPNASHMIQPLDKGFFVPLKSAYSTECDKFMVRNPGRVITHREVYFLFCRAYERVATLEKAKNSFRATGIFPFNPEIFTEDDFLSKPQQKIQLNPDVKESQQVRQDTFQTNSLSRPDGENNLNGQVCSPSTLLRLPSANLQSKRKRTEKKSEIMTSSPYKNALEASGRKQTEGTDQKSIWSKEKKRMRIDPETPTTSKENCNILCPGCGKNIRNR